LLRNTEYELVDGVLTVFPGMRHLRSQEFCQNDEIKKLIVLPGVNSMEEEVFTECQNLEEAELPEGMVNIGVACFASCINLRKINVPSTVTEIQDGAFLFCEKLTSLTLPEGLRSINSLAFQGSGLSSVTIGKNAVSIGEEAFFECESLRRADVLNPDCVIEENAFGSCYGLIEGYIAPGYPVEHSAPAELLYTLLWCTCPERHSPETTSRAESFIRAQEKLVMEKILKYDNVPALTGIVERGLLNTLNIDGYLRQALENRQTQLSALLLKAKGTGRDMDEEFEL